jgi:hypothetical protein
MDHTFSALKNFTSSLAGSTMSKILGKYHHPLEFYAEASANNITESKSCFESTSTLGSKIVPGLVPTRTGSALVPNCPA